jgi:large subunit ribosomal protein L30
MSAIEKKNELLLHYYRSSIGRPEKQRKVLAGLGFRKLNQVIRMQDTPEIRGMVAKIPHLVRIVDDNR